MASEEDSAKSQVYTEFRGNVTHASISATCHFWTIFDNCNLPCNKHHPASSGRGLFTFLNKRMLPLSSAEASLYIAGAGRIILSTILSTRPGNIPCNQKNE